MDGGERPGYGSIQQCQPHSVPVAGELQYRAHPGRFYVLVVFSLFALVQSLGWLTFGTIPDESYTELGLTDNDITLIAGIRAGSPFLYLQLAATRLGVIMVMGDV
jgi:hypothetical protein